jgi:hypothetical protein
MNTSDERDYFADLSVLEGALPGPGSLHTG